MKKVQIDIKSLYNSLAEKFDIQTNKTYEVIYPKDVEIKVLGNKYVKLVAVSRHKTTKHLIKIVVKVETTINSLDPINQHQILHRYEDVIVTTDHVCMIYNNDHFFESINAKNLKINDYVSVYTELDDKELVGTIVKIEDLGKTDDYVYDCEVDDYHAFYANNILVHNSQFVHIGAVTDYFKQEYGLCDDLAEWDDESKLKLWKWMDDFVENEVNPFVQNDLIGKTYHTEHPEVLRYSLEYVGSVGIYERKKHYAVRKIISEGPELVDKIKFSGIELKKASVPPAVKDILRDIYMGVLTKNWAERDFINYVNASYDKFKELTISDLAMWKGYNTGREASGFLQMELGATGISKACTYYNQLIEHLKIGKKYDMILLGQKIRFAYIIPGNEYGIECIAFHDGQWPKEFDEIFKVDYDVMFDKMVISPLKGFLEATKFKQVDPRKQVLFDIFDL
jgi:hypothetical protein